LKLEKLAQVPGWGDYYCNLLTGALYSYKKGKLKRLSDYVSMDGYIKNPLSQNGKVKTYNRASIIKASGDKVPINSWKSDSKEIDHLNENTLDNCYFNLDFKTREGQYTEKLRNKLSDLKYGKPRNKLSEKDVREIRKSFTESKMKITTYAKIVARNYDISWTHSYNLLRNKAWKNVI